MSKFLTLGAEPNAALTRPLDLSSLCGLSGPVTWYSTPEARMKRRNELARALKLGVLPAPPDVAEDTTLAPHGVFYDGNTMFMYASPFLSDETLGKGFFKRVKRAVTPPRTPGGKKKLRKLVKTTAIVVGAAGAAYVGGAMIASKFAAKTLAQKVAATSAKRLAGYAAKGAAKKGLFSFLGGAAFKGLGKTLGAAASSIGVGVLTDKLRGKPKANTEAFLEDPVNRDFIRDEGAAYVRDGATLHKLTSDPDGGVVSQQFPQAQVPMDSFEALPEGVPVLVPEDKGDDLRPPAIAGSSGLRPGGGFDEPAIRGEEIPASRAMVLSQDTAMQASQIDPSSPPENTTPMEDALARAQAPGAPSQAVLELMNEPEVRTTSGDEESLGALLGAARARSRKRDAAMRKNRSNSMKPSNRISPALSEFARDSRRAAHDAEGWDLQGLAAQAKASFPPKPAAKRAPGFFESLFTGIYEGAAGEAKAAIKEYSTFPVDKEMAVLEGMKSSLHSLSIQMDDLLKMGVSRLLAMRNAKADAFSDSISKAARQAQAQARAVANALDRALSEGEKSRRGILSGILPSKAMTAFLVASQQAKSQFTAAKLRLEAVRASYNTFWTTAVGAGAMGPMQMAKGAGRAVAATAREAAGFALTTAQRTGGAVMEAGKGIESITPYVKYWPYAAAGVAGLYVLSMLPRGGRAQ